MSNVISFPARASTCTRPASPALPQSRADRRKRLALKAAEFVKEALEPFVGRLTACGEMEIHVDPPSGVTVRLKSDGDVIVEVNGVVD